MEKILNYKKELVIGGMFLFSILLSVYSLISISNIENKKQENVDYSLNIATSEMVDEEYYVYVDIKGEVNKPGVYKMLSTSIVNDVIKKAGGLTKLADTRSISLSKKVFDEMVIIVHSKNELKDYQSTKEKENIINQYCKNYDYDIKNDGCIESDIATNEDNKTFININTATKEMLMTLSGIGEQKAIDIIEYREKNLFQSIEEIKNVSGIGDSLFAKIKDFITI